jgi:hypothetical protein
MFSVDNFYAYLSHCYGRPAKDNYVFSFMEHGSRNLLDLANFTTDAEQKNLGKYCGALVMFDQEPFSLDSYEFDFNSSKFQWQDSSQFYHFKYYTKFEQICRRISRMQTSIICHSELNSPDIKQFEDAGFLSVHYWWHGLVTRDWFRHWKHYGPNKSATNNRLGCYIRDTSGTRKYRKDVLDLVEQQRIYCPMLDGKTYTSEASAMLEWDDVNLFDIHIVAETLFDTPKTHLTEKVLKPVAMEQPFILFAGPYSLEYMRRYGFQTFGCCWDESYDAIEDSQERYRAVVDLIKHLSSMPAKQYSRILKRAKLIAANNREHFYSQQFEDMLLDELHTNMKVALVQQEENFKRDPGGMYFAAAQELAELKKQDPLVPDHVVDVPRKLLAYMKQHNPTVAKQILKQYPELF